MGSVIVREIISLPPGTREDDGLTKKYEKVYQSFFFSLITRSSTQDSFAFFNLILFVLLPVMQVGNSMAFSMKFFFLLLFSV